MDRDELREGFIVGCGTGMLVAGVVVMGLLWFGR